MGMSFRNIQIYNPGHEMKYDLEDDFCIEYLDSNWDTVMEDSLDTDYDAVKEEAVRLSERLDAPVISVYYFDDMIFEMEILVAGKTVAYHLVDDEGMETKNIPMLIEALRVESTLEIPFRNIIKKVNFGPDALNFISDLCRIPLDSSCIDDEPDTYKYKNMSEVLDSISNFTSVL